MKLFKILSSAAFSLSLLLTAYIPEVKAGETIFQFDLDGTNWQLKVDTSGTNSGKFFLRKNRKKSVCKQWVVSTSTLEGFMKCSAKQIGSDIFITEMKSLISHYIK